jgi:hypothetical protein
MGPNGDERRPSAMTSTDASSRRRSSLDAVCRILDIGRRLYPQAVRKAVDERRVERFHVKRCRWIMDRSPTYPQGVHAFYVAFHVKRWGLWITSVDNFWCAAMPTDGDVLRRWDRCLNG